MTSSIGYPATGPDDIASWIPSRTEGMYSLGIVPPVIFDSEDEPRSDFAGPDVNLHMPVLTAPSGLAHESTRGVDGVAQALFVCDLGPADVGLYLEFAEQSVSQNFEVELPHSRDDGLSRILVYPDDKCRVLVGQLAQCQMEMLLIGPGPGPRSPRERPAWRILSFPGERDGPHRTRCRRSSCP